MMRFENYYGENSCSACCPECTLTTECHCAHCPQFRRAGSVHIPEGYDYSHLIASPAKQDDKVFDTARFDVLLTEYDRILLGFGMRITWQVQPMDVDVTSGDKPSNWITSVVADA